MKNLMYLLACLSFLSFSTHANDSAEALQNAFIDALKANNAQGLADCYSSDAVNFPVDSMMGHGPDSVRESWNGFFATYKVIGASLSETHLETLGDTAVAWGLFTILAEPAQGGDAIEMKGRYMDVARNTDKGWLYVADHASLPLPVAED
jgi:uncharacterized protein (TIGR02246 family)